MKAQYNYKKNPTREMTPVYKPEDLTNGMLTLILSVHSRDAKIELFHIFNMKLGDIYKAKRNIHPLRCSDDVACKSS